MIPASGGLPRGFRRSFVPRTFPRDILSGPRSEVCGPRRSGGGQPHFVVRLSPLPQTARRCLLLAHPPRSQVRLDHPPRRRCLLSAGSPGLRPPGQWHQTRPMLILRGSAIGLELLTDSVPVSAGPVHFAKNAFRPRPMTPSEPASHCSTRRLLLGVGVRADG